ncbi:MAG: ribonuclease HIII [Bacilli bacterium]
MSNYVITLSKSELSNLQKAFPGGDFAALPPGAVWRYKGKGVSIIAYRSGKVMFQGANATTVGSKWGSPSGQPQSAKPSSTPSFAATDWNEKHTVGSDEVGTGDFFGGINVAAAYVQPEDVSWLRKLGVDDSKAMNDVRIRNIVDEIKERIPHAEYWLTPERYNKGISQKYNQGELKALCHFRAQSALLEKLRPKTVDYVVIDQFAAPNVYARYLKRFGVALDLQNGEQWVSMTKAESQVVAVATASVIARARFLDLMDEMSSEWGFQFPKGAGANVDRIGRDWVRLHGFDKLNEVAKTHFSNSQRVR